MYVDNFYDGDDEVEYCCTTPLPSFQIDKNLDAHVTELVNIAKDCDTCKVTLTMSCDEFVMTGLNINEVHHKVRNISCASSIGKYFCYVYREPGSESYSAAVFQCKAAEHARCLSDTCERVFNEAYQIHKGKL